MGLNLSVRVERNEKAVTRLGESNLDLNLIVADRCPLRKERGMKLWDVARSADVRDRELGQRSGRLCRGGSVIGLFVRNGRRLLSIRVASHPDGEHGNHDQQTGCGREEVGLFRPRL